METLLITAHYILCTFLILVILLQAGKGADIGAVFGGASQTVFGGRGPATFLNKITAFVAAGFIVTSVWLAHIAKTQSGTTVIDRASSTSVIPAADKPLMDLEKEANEAPPATGPAEKAEEKKSE